jgi:hypothetical protein
MICLEFNKHRDFQDTEQMIEAARRESNAVSKEHLKEIEEKIKRMKNGDEPVNDLKVD